MLNFLGNSEAKLDNKGRVPVPAQFRKLLQSVGAESLVLQKDIFRNCLTIYPPDVWEENVSEFQSRLNKWNSEHRQLLRQFVDAERVEIDPSGRILISKRYLKDLNIKSDVQFLGVVNIIEMWPKGNLEETIIPSEEFGQKIERLMGETPGAGNQQPITE